MGAAAFFSFHCIIDVKGPTAGCGSTPRDAASGTHTYLISEGQSRRKWESREAVCGTEA